MEDKVLTAPYKIDDALNRLSKNILDTCFYVHTQLGPGLMERVYEDCVFHFLKEKHLKVEKQKYIPIRIEGLTIPSGLKIDLLIEDQIILELKSCEKILPLHEAQLQTYMKLSNIPLGLLINFNVRSLKDGIKRMAMAQNQKQNFV